MEDRWSRLAPLTGVLFALITLAAFLSSGGETPNSNASPRKVVLYYAAHRSEVETSAILFSLAFVVLLLFAGALRSYLRRTAGAEGLAALVLAGGAVMLAGAGAASGIEYGLAHQLYHLGPQTAQALNFLTMELGLVIVAGAFVFAIASGLAILRGAPLPNWLGYVAILLGILAVIPPTGIIGLFGFLLWSAIAGVLIYRRLSAAPQDARPAAPQQA